VEGHVLRFKFQFVDEQLKHLLRHHSWNLEAHGPTEPAPTEFHLYGREEALGVIIVERQVGVS